jgi:hypothetical protein
MSETPHEHGIRRSRTRSELVEIVILLALGAVSTAILVLTLFNNI